MQTTALAFIFWPAFELSGRGCCLLQERVCRQICNPLAQSHCVGAQEAQLRETRRGPALRPAGPSPRSTPGSPPPQKKRTSPLWHLVEADTATPVINRAPEVAMVIFGRFVVFRIPSVDPLAPPSGKPALSARSRKGKERRRSQKVGAAA